MEDSRMPGDELFRCCRGHHRERLSSRAIFRIAGDIFNQELEMREVSGLHILVPKNKR